MTAKVIEKSEEIIPQISQLVAGGVERVAELEVLRALLAKMASAQPASPKLVYSSFPANNSDE